MAEHEQAVLTGAQRAAKAHATDGFLIEIRLTQQVKQPVGLSVDHFEMLVDHNQEEASSKLGLRLQ